MDLAQRTKVAIGLSDTDICTIASMAVDDTNYAIVWRCQWNQVNGWLALSQNIERDILVEVHHDLNVHVSFEGKNGTWLKDDVQNQAKIFRYFFDKGLIGL